MSSFRACGKNARRAARCIVVQRLDPFGHVHLPGVFVQRIVHTGPQNKRIEKRTVRTEKEAN